MSFRCLVRARGFTGPSRELCCENCMYVCMYVGGRWVGGHLGMCAFVFLCRCKHVCM